MGILIPDNYRRQALIQADPEVPGIDMKELLSTPVNKKNREKGRLFRHPLTRSSRFLHLYGSNVVNTLLPRNTTRVRSGYNLVNSSFHCTLVAFPRNGIGYTFSEAPCGERQTEKEETDERQWIGNRHQA